MSKYSRLSQQERCSIEMGIRSRKSIGAIARTIERSKKTVSMEIRRNGGYLGYYAAKAHCEAAKSNRLGYSKIDKIPKLVSYIREKLVEKWSPEVIAGRWNKDNPGSKISYESIYTWIYNQDGDLYLSLPRKKKKRGLKPQRNKSNIANRTSIHVRPEVINNRSEVGHYEGDLVFQQGNRSQNILSIVERKSRMIILKKNQSKHSDVVMRSFNDAKSKSKYRIKSVTFDNGSEFANHSKLGIDTYFCDPGSPWQKGAVEHANGIVRRYLDYKIDAALVTQEILDSIAESINNKPRKILGFLTPNEVMANLYREKSVGVTF